jgi:hypothetical protein
VQAEQTELLRQIAANTAVLPKIAADLCRIVADYDAGRISKREPDRRIGLAVSRMVQ